MGRPMSRFTVVDPRNPLAAGQCDLCDGWYPLRSLRKQVQWAGTHLYSFNSLRCYKCWDIPQEQLRTIILPPDPAPLPNTRVPNFAYDNQTVRLTQRGGRAYEQPFFPFADPPWNAGPERLRALQGGTIARIIQLNPYPYNVTQVTTVPSFVPIAKTPPPPPVKTSGTQVFIPTVLAGLL
jgi:hypothetical protein